MKKLLSLVLVLAMTVALVGCGSSNKSTDSSSSSKSDVKIGVILIGDDTEGYTKAHIDGIKEAQKELNIADSNIVWKYSIPESDQCTKTAEELVAQGCSLIIANSYGHEDFITQAAQKNPNVNFVSLTGDYAAISGLKNLYNAFTNVYQSRYVSGVVAGMKIAELAKENKIPKKSLDKDGKVKIGYVGAFPYAEVVSGYTAFFLGVQSAYKDVSMEVTYTDSWFDIDAEAAAAESLMSDGCVIIGQHADSTGAPTAVQKKQDNGTVAFSVGYNVDMLSVAKTAALTSSTNNWGVYYKDLFKAAMDKKAITQDWAQGYDTGAVAITKLGESCAKGTDAKVKEVEKALKDGTLNVFDTSKFTVTGDNVKLNKDKFVNITTDKSGKVTSNKIDLSYYDYSGKTPKEVYHGETKEAIETKDGVSYFSESTLRSAPYFQIRIDGIKELNK